MSVFFFYSPRSMSRMSATRHIVRDLVIVAVGLAVVERLSVIMRDVRLTPGLRADVQRAKAWALTLSVWPLVWNGMAIDAAPAAKVGFFWPFAVLLSDLYLVAPRLGEARARTRLEQGTVCSMAIVLCGMASMSGAKTPAHQRLFVLPLLAYVVLVVPSVGDEASSIVAPLQHTVFACITGLFIAGVLYRREMLPLAEPDAVAPRSNDGGEPHAG